MFWPTKSELRYIPSRSIESVEAGRSAAISPSSENNLRQALNFEHIEARALDFPCLNQHAISTRRLVRVGRTPSARYALLFAAQTLRVGVGRTAARDAPNNR